MGTGRKKEAHFAKPPAGVKEEEGTTEKIVVEGRGWYEGDRQNGGGPDNYVLATDCRPLIPFFLVSLLRWFFFSFWLLFTRHSYLKHRRTLSCCSSKWYFLSPFPTSCEPVFFFNHSFLRDSFLSFAFVFPCLIPPLYSFFFALFLSFSPSSVLTFCSYSSILF
jgi:hypothetical protein